MEDNTESQTTPTPAQEALKETADVAEAEGKQPAADFLRETAEGKKDAPAVKPTTETPAETITPSGVLQENADQAQAEGKTPDAVQVLKETATQTVPKQENDTIESLVPNEEKETIEGKVLTENHVESKKGLFDKIKSILPGKKKPPTPQGTQA